MVVSTANVAQRIDRQFHHLLFIHLWASKTSGHMANASYDFSLTTFVSNAKKERFQSDVPSHWITDMKDVVDLAQNQDWLINLLIEFFDTNRNLVNSQKKRSGYRTVIVSNDNKFTFNNYDLIRCQKERLSIRLVVVKIFEFFGSHLIQMYWRIDTHLMSINTPVTI